MAKNEAAATKESANLPASYDAYEQYAGQGLEDITSEDKGLPFFEVLQPLSPEIEEVEGAQAGMIVNRATKELFTDIRFVPVCRQHVYTEWVPRDSGGGLVGTYPVTDPIVVAARAKQRVGKHELDNGNELIETFYLFGLVLGENDEATPAVIAFTSTKIAAYKQLTTRADSLMFRTSDGRKLKYPWFAHVWRLGTEKKKKDKYTWYTWTVGFDSQDGKADGARLMPDSPILSMASDLFQSQKAGELKLNTENVTNDMGDGRSDAVSPGMQDLDGDEPPF